MPPEVTPQTGPIGAHWRFRVLTASRLLLDAGSMFGLIPKAVWSRSVPVDDANRMAMAHNCVLLERDADDGGPRRVIIETGTGDKLDAKMAGIFGLDGRTVHAELNSLSVDPASIDLVAVTHLHFDHAGGLTRRALDGETPDWTAPDAKSASGDHPDVMRTFPNARVAVQQREWEDALANTAVMTRTYYRDHLDPIREHVSLLDSPAPFPPGVVPKRDEGPATSADERATPIAPGIDVLLAPGHTWGQQAIRFRDEYDRVVVFVPDVMPTAWHVGAAYSLAYDVEPYTSMLTRRWLLAEAQRNGWLLLLDHQPGHPLFSVEPDDRGWFRLAEAPLTPPSAGDPA